ncbi:hypothetical protein SAMN05446037_1004159 [Anaerovirgula multivorans]|uniref:Uncharacterized protein n=1 Tax=Anaerovirgula multivorans TaxID=312168 RepID=A0A239BXE3_9FIRM|nr:YeeE/YedE family protein [Anaerovirgula multivorans]SNS11833.1 hypothetical protein SAMN05446037_1004159 [Anaerovirgula multivorans]
MTSSRIEALKKQKQMEIRKKNNQMHYAVLGTTITFMIYFMLINYHLRLSSFWIIGILLGITMQRSRFCFASSFRDPIMVGSTSLLKAVLLAFIISTIGFFIIQYKTIVLNPDYLITEIPGQLSPVGIHTAIGAVLFGVGMVVAGGCASGTLIRIGEGYMMQLVVLIGFIIGSTLGAKHFVFWDKTLISKAPIIYFPKYLGFFPSLILQLILLCSLYYIADWYDKKNNITITM